MYDKHIYLIKETQIIRILHITTTSILVHFVRINKSEKLPFTILDFYFRYLFLSEENDKSLIE